MAFNRDEIIPKLCERLAQGESLFVICSGDGFPNRSTIQRWCDDDPEIAAGIARARILGFDERAERAVEEAKSAKDAGLARLSFDAERWYLSKLNPQRYGERTTIAGDPDAPLVAPSDPAAAMAAILAAARTRKDNDGSDLA